MHEWIVHKLTLSTLVNRTDNKIRSFYSDEYIATANVPAISMNIQISTASVVAISMTLQISTASVVAISTTLLISTASVVAISMTLLISTASVVAISMNKQIVKILNVLRSFLNYGKDYFFFNQLGTT